MVLMRMRRNNTYILIATLLLVAHATEEYLSKFYDIDSSVQFLASNIGTTPLVALVLVHLVLALFLLILVFNQKNKLLFAVLGLILLFESHHIIESVLIGSYYPGVITAVLIVVFCFFFWRRFILEVKI